jgi:hypothetical protein
MVHALPSISGTGKLAAAASSALTGADAALMPPPPCADTAFSSPPLPVDFSA